MAERTPAERLPGVLWPMMFGNVVIGTGVMVVAGLLNEVRHDLAVSVSTAGHLIGWAALVVCVGAPVVAASVTRWDRRHLLVGCLYWYGLWHALGALAPHFEALLATRMLAMLAAAAFTPQAAACIGQLVPAEQRGRAITFVFLGWSVASVLGTPLGAWVGGQAGWRWTFGLMAVLSLAGALWLQRRMPRGVVPPSLSRQDWARTLTSAPLMLALSVTVTFAAGQFVVLSYLAPFVAEQHGLGPNGLSGLLLVYGAFGFVGNALLSRHIDRLRPHRAVGLAIASMALGLTALALWPHSAMLWPAMVAWGLGVFASNSAQQARLVGLAPSLASASIALNTSAMYAGQALGATIGAALIARQGLGALPGAGAALLVLALALSTSAAAWARRHPGPSAS